MSFFFNPNITFFTILSSLLLLSYPTFLTSSSEKKMEVAEVMEVARKKKKKSFKKLIVRFLVFFLLFIAASYWSYQKIYGHPPLQKQGVAGDQQKNIGKESKSNGSAYQKPSSEAYRPLSSNKKQFSERSSYLKKSLPAGIAKFIDKKEQPGTYLIPQKKYDHLSKMDKPFVVLFKRGVILFQMPKAGYQGSLDKVIRDQGFIYSAYGADFVITPHYADLWDYKSHQGVKVKHNPIQHHRKTDEDGTKGLRLYAIQEVLDKLNKKKITDTSGYSFFIGVGVDTPAAYQELVVVGEKNSIPKSAPPFSGKRAMYLGTHKNFSVEVQKLIDQRKLKKCTIGQSGEKLLNAYNEALLKGEKAILILHTTC